MIGTGGLTNKFLSDLKSDYGERLYYKYTFTDVSSGFFVQAQERFKDYAGIEYQALDISQDPLEQGFKAGEYDLIIASNVSFQAGSVALISIRHHSNHVPGVACYPQPP